MDLEAYGPPQIQKIEVDEDKESPRFGEPENYTVYLDCDLRLLEITFTGSENLEMSMGAGPSTSIPTISFLLFRSRITLSEMGSLSATFPLFNRI